MNTTESLLKGILAMVARNVMPPSEVMKIVAPTAGSQKQVQAYNMCDGNTLQSDIGKKLKLDSGNLSRSISRWEDAGIIVRVGPDHYPLHIYPLPKK